MTKYGNVWTEADGIKFQSKHEAMRWIELKYMARAGLITNLERQVSFELIPAQKRNGKIVEHAVRYVADFTYKTKDGEYVVEDAKSPATVTQVYKIKRKLMLWRHGIQVREV